MDSHLVDTHVAKSGAQKGHVEERCKSNMKRKVHQHEAKSSLFLLLRLAKYRVKPRN